MSQITSSDANSSQTYNDLKFHNSKLIGDGSIAKVFLLSYKSKHIAVKVIDKKKKPWNYNQKQFERQTKILRILSHPNLVKFIQSYANNKAFQIGMEYCPGKNLRQILTSPDQIPKDFLQYFQIKMSLDIINGLSFLSQKMIIHRDIKPENIIVQIDKQGNISTTIIDFGSARFIYEEVHSFIGSPFCYMAPEIYFRKPYSESCDDWSLGMLIFELFTITKNKGKICSPFKQNYYAQDHSFYSQFYDEQIWSEGISLDKNTIPKPIRKIIRGLLKPDPQKRMKKSEIIQILIDEFDQFSKVFKKAQEKTQENEKLYACLEIQNQRPKRLQQISKHLKNIRVLYRLFLKIKKTLQEDQSIKTAKIRWNLIIAPKIIQQISKIEQIVEVEPQKKNQENEYPQQIRDILSKEITQNNIQNILSNVKQYKNYFFNKKYNQSPKFIAIDDVLKKFLNQMQKEQKGVTTIIQELLKKDVI